MCPHSRLEPIVEFDNVRVLHALQHLELVVHHLLVSAHILLQYDLDRDLALGAVSLSDDTVCAGAQRLSEAITRSVFCLVCGSAEVGPEQRSP